MHSLDERLEEPIPLRREHRHPPAHRNRRFGTASLDRQGVVTACDEIWEREVGVPLGAGIATAVCAADAPYLFSLLARTDDGLSVAVRTGHRDSDVTVLLHLEGAFRNGAWHVIGMPTFLPRHTEASALAGEEASRDALTGLLDRVAFDAALADALRRCTRGDSAALLLIDLDGFKRFNDLYGHTMGDQLLKAVGLRIGESLRDGDCAARFGGDEFAVIVRRATQLDARIAAERVLSAVRCARAGDLELMAGVHASIGMVVLRPGDDLVADEAMTRADLALYEAKATGRSGVAEYPSGDAEAAVRMRVRMTWGQRLHRALEHDRLEPHAQPIVDLHSGALVACELVLFLHDGDELLHVDAFREHAVRAGLIDRVDQWLLRRVVEIAADATLPLAEVPLGISVTSAVLDDRSLTARLHNDLSAAGVDAQRIVLQLRDSSSADLPVARETALGLRRLGIGLALDGFGGRVGSLMALRELPFTQLRLDPAVTSAESTSALDDTVITYAVAVGTEFGLDVIAAGIETPADAVRVRDLGVGFGEGGLFGGPQPVAQAPAFPRAERLL
ncbi:MAG: EAL domain-containing protein [Gaiellales bacterium]